MVLRVASIVLSLAGLLALILGLLFWIGIALHLIPLHMLLGLLAVAALWVIGIGQGFLPAGNWIIAAVAVAVGAAMIALGLTQSALMLGAQHWIVRVIHLVLGILTIGIGHMAAARCRKSPVAS